MELLKKARQIHCFNCGKSTLNLHVIEKMGTIDLDLESFLKSTNRVMPNLFLISIVSTAIKPGCPSSFHFGSRAKPVSVSLTDWKPKLLARFKAWVGEEPN